jgi:hypothetical protein
MNIGLIDVDKTRFPNLALMKIAAYHRSLGDSVEEIPEEYRTLIVAYLCYDGSIKYAYVAYYQNGVFYDEYDEYKTYESFSCWMYLPTPSLPKTQSK